MFGMRKVDTMGYNSMMTACQLHSSRARQTDEQTYTTLIA